MGNFIDAVNDAVRSTACGIIGGTSFIDGFMRDVGVPGTGAYEERTRALRRQLCDDDDDNVPLPPPPSDEDCLVGNDYSDIGGIRWEITNVDGVVDTFCASKVNEVERIGGTAFWRYLDCNGTARNETVFEAGAKPQTVSAASSGCCDGETNPVPSCDPTIPEYVPTPTTVNISYENNQQITVNEDIDVTIFAPQVNLIGGIFAPVVIAGNTFQLAGTVELTPEFKLEINPEINVGTGGGNTDSPAPEPDKPIPEPSLDSNERRVIVGAVVTATAVNNRQDFLPQGENPDIAIPNLGYLNFYIATNDARAWTSDIPIKNVRSYIPCPAPAGAVDVAGTARNGVSLEVQPVWGYPGQQV